MLLFLLVCGYTDTISQLSQQHCSVCSFDFDYRYCYCCCYKRFHPHFASRERGMSDAAARAAMLCSTMTHFLLQRCNDKPFIYWCSCDCCCCYCFERWSFWPFGAAAAPSVALLVLPPPRNRVRVPDSVAASCSGARKAVQP